MVCRLCNKRKKKIAVTYIESTEKIADIRFLIPELKRRGYTHINYIDPTDNWLQKRLNKGLKEEGFTYKQYTSPLFFKFKRRSDFFFLSWTKKKYNQTSFYIEQRKKHSNSSRNRWKNP